MATQRVSAANNETGKFTLGNFRGPLQLLFQGTDGRKMDCFLLKFSLTSISFFQFGDEGCPRTHEPQQGRPPTDPEGHTTSPCQAGPCTGPPGHLVGAPARGQQPPSCGMPLLPPTHPQNGVLPPCPQLPKDGHLKVTCYHMACEDTCSMHHTCEDTIFKTH